MADRTAVRLHVLGSSSAVPRPGRANSGYLLESGGSLLAFEFGTGVFARLRSVADPARLRAVLISHMHADHYFDLVPLRYALRYEVQRREPLPVLLPPGGLKPAHQIARALKPENAFYRGILALDEYDPAVPLELDPFRVRFARMEHYIPAYGMRIETPEGIVAFSADTAPCEALAGLAAGADILLCEASLGAEGTERGRRGHLNASEAGAIAQQAGVRHLVLTHYPASAAPATLRSAAARAFGGTITIADDGAVLALREANAWE